MKKINQTEKDIKKIEKNLKNYEIQSPHESELISTIRNEIFKRKKVELKKNNLNIIQRNINTVYEHQKLTSVAIHPFYKIHNDTRVSKHFLIGIDPFVSIDENKNQIKNFDALILNLEEKYNTLIFLETKTSGDFAKAISGVIKKIVNYESFEMQVFIKKYFKDKHNLEKIDRIEYVLVTYPYNVNERMKLRNRKIRVRKSEDREEEIPLPLIIWSVNRAHKDNEANFYYLLYFPINDDMDEARKFRQHHNNNNLIRFLSQKEKVDVSTKLFSLKFSPVLDFNYQFIMITTELLKLYKDNIFNKDQMKNLIFSQLILNLKKEKIAEYLADKFLKIGLSTGIYKEKVKSGYQIRLGRVKQALEIQKEIIEKVSLKKAENMIRRPEIKLDLLKKVEITYKTNKERKGSLITDFFQKK
ncbi:MAG: hypothetical protein ACFFAS_18615 [Promethearchaeota archaeon]